MPCRTYLGDTSLIFYVLVYMDFNTPKYMQSPFPVYLNVILLMYTYEQFLGMSSYTQYFFMAEKYGPWAFKCRVGRISATLS